MRSSFQFQMNKKESVICEFEIGFKKSFCWHSNRSNIDTIFVHVNMYVGFCDQESKNPWSTSRAVILISGVAKRHDSTSPPGCSRILIQRTEVSFAPVFKSLYSQLFFFWFLFSECWKIIYWNLKKKNEWWCRQQFRLVENKTFNNFAQMFSCFFFPFL